MNFTSSTDSRIGTERSLRIAELDRRRQLLLELRQQRLDAVHDLHRVRARLPLDGEVDRARAVVPAGVPLVLDAGVDVRDLVQADRAAVALRDDDRRCTPARPAAGPTPGSRSCGPARRACPVGRLTFY